MAIKRPDIYEHNNPNNAIADSDGVRGGIRTKVSDLTALYALSTKTDQLKEYSTTVWVVSENKYYVLVDISQVDNSDGWRGNLITTDNTTRVIQMLPPELLSSPRRIKIPVVDGEENDVPIIWKILGVEYTEDEEQIIEIADAEEDHYRKDLILGTQSGTVIKFAGTESEEGIIEPIQPENTVLLTSIVVFGNTTYEDPEPPIIGSEFVKKMGYRNLYLTYPGSVTTAPVLSEDKRNTVIQSSSGLMIIDGFKDGMPGQPSTLYQGMIVTIDNQTTEEVPVNDMTNSTNPNSDIKIDFRSGISQYIMKPGEFLTFKLRGSVLVFVSTNKAEVDVEVPTKTSDLTNDGADGTSTYIELSDVGEADGVAPIGSDKKIPLSFFPDAILGQVVFGGTVVPTTGVATLSTNAKTKLGTTDATITLTNDTTPITGYEANEGIYYIAFDDGTFGGITLTVGDWLISTGSGWSKIDNTDAVTMVNGKTGAVTLNAADIGYSNTESGLDAENVQEAIDEVQGNIEQETTDRQLAIETAGFIARTGTAIAFDKWATYNSYSSPSSGNYSYDLTNAVVGMVQVSYHEDIVVPTFSQAGIDVIIVGEYQPNIVNKTMFELIGETRILVNVTPL